MESCLFNSLPYLNHVHTFKLIKLNCFHNLQIYADSREFEWINFLKCGYVTSLCEITFKIVLIILEHITKAPLHYLL